MKRQGLVSYERPGVWRGCDLRIGRTHAASLPD